MSRPAAPRPELVVRDLSKSFGQRQVVHGVSLDLAPGQVIGLLGPNGAGKTTTFKMILGLERPDQGQVELGQPLDHLPLHSRARLGLGYLPQGPSVLQGMTARDNLLALLQALKKPDPAARAAELLARFGLEEVALQKARTLSGGERRRLEFARALCSDPLYLLCDEPFSGVDPLAAQQIARSITLLADSNVGVLLTDHSVNQALGVCHQIYLLIEGSIVEQGTPTQIRNSKTAQALYLGPP